MMLESLDYFDNKKKIKEGKFSKGDKVISTKNIKFEGENIPNNSVGKVIDYWISFGSNKDNYSIEFEEIGIFDFDNYSSQYLKKIEESNFEKRLYITKLPNGNYGYIGPIQSEDKALVGREYSNYQDALDNMKDFGYELFESKLKEIRSLVPIHIYWNEKNSFTLTYLGTGSGKVFNGSPENFAKFLKRLGAKESSSYPRSTRYKTYMEIVNDVISGKDPNVYVWSNILASIPERIINESNLKEKDYSGPGWYVFDKDENFIKGPFKTQSDAEKECGTEEHVGYFSTNYQEEYKIKTLGD